MTLAPKGVRGCEPDAAAGIGKIRLLARCLGEHMKPSEVLRRYRAAIRRVIESHRTRNGRVFGSVLRGEDTEQSDLDLLVDPTPETTLFDLGAIRAELRELLGVPVDVLTPRALPDRVRAAVLSQAQPV